MKERYREIDVLKGFSIFLMMFDHVGWGGGVHTYIQSFHMPLFFIVSGFLWKSGGQSTKKIAIGKARKMLVPYAFFSTLYLTIQACEACFERTNQSMIMTLKAVVFYPTDMSNMPFAPALWFLPCFWLSNSIYALLDRLFGKRKWIPIFVLTTTGMAYSSLSDVMLPWCIEPMLVALFFMYLGEQIKEYKNTLYAWLENWWVLIILLCMEAVLAFINGSCDMRSARYHNCILYLINAVTGTVCYWGISRKAIDIMPTYIINVICYLSINSMVFLCTNQVFISIFYKVMNKISVVNTDILTVFKFSCLLFTLIACSGLNSLLLKSRFRFAIGR